MAFENIHTDYATDRIDLPSAAELIDMHEAGASWDDIADDYGCSAATVTSRVHQSGLLQSRKAQQEALRESRASEDDEVADITALIPKGDVRWMARSLCPQTDPDEFFPNKGAATRQAKAICARCPVAAECLDYALANGERFGIWGGLSESERRKVKAAIKEEQGVAVAEIPCERCERTFTKAQYLLRHVREFHDREELELPCPACDFVATNEGGLTSHTIRKHPELRTRVMTTTTTAPISAVKKLAILRHLAGGKSLEVTASIIGMDRSEVLDIASNHGYPDRDKLSWAADVLSKKVDEDAAASTPAATGPSPHHSVIDAGLQHLSKRVRNAAQRCLDNIDRLRELIAEDEKKNATKRKAEAEKAKAKAEVERLKAELAAAQAKLRPQNSTKATTLADGPSSKEIRSWARHAGVECPGTGRVPASVREAYAAAHPVQEAS